jgi:hypothetical protein
MSGSAVLTIEPIVKKSIPKNSFLCR